MMNSGTIAIERLKIPLPFALRWVNAYLVPGSDGWIVIDPGLHTPEAEQVWLDELKRRGIRFADIEAVVLTHYHPDHYGLAGWFQERCGGRLHVWLSETGRAHAEMMWGLKQTMSEELPALFARHGMEPAKLEQMRPHLDSFIPLVSPQPELQIVRPEDEFRWGDQTFRAIETSGHAAGHLCFYNERENVMICGDHVLPQITPNVSLLPGSDPDPLHSFLTGLNQLRTYEVRCAFPGHRDPFSRWTERIDQIVRHHDERLARIIDLLDRPATAYMVCVKLFGEQLSTHQLRFAMSETLAHLVYLKHRGKIKEHDGEDVCYYSANV